MLEIRRGKAVRHYENSFFREFAKNLKNMFNKYNFDGLLIANPECTVDERLQIDTLLVTKHVVCIIDFKNFGGKIILPTEDDFFNGIWTNENGDRIKGGSSINPYKQLHIQKKKFQNNQQRDIIGIYEKFIKENIVQGDSFEPRHILKMVCFQKEITLEGEIPSRSQIDFFITSQANYLEQIKDIMDITSDDINLSINSYEAFKKVFKASEFDLKESYETETNIEENLEININTLYQDQKVALSEINNFLIAKDKKVFILNGSSNSGKSHLIPFIEELAYKQKFQEIHLLCRSRLIANNLSSASHKFNSMMSYIYGGKSIQITNDNYTDLCSYDEKTINNEIQEGIEIIPLKENTDDNNCLYIIDIAQLIDIGCHRFPNLQFGTGHLLNDFFKYIDIHNSNRKVLFIGDTYLINYSKKEENALYATCLKNNFEVVANSFSLLDKPNYSKLTKEFLEPIEGMRRQKFNLLKFDFFNNFKKIDKEEITKYVANNLLSDFKVLVYSNNDAQKINLWIKKSILKNGKDINTADLILFYNNIELENNNPFSQPQKLFNGEFATIKTVNNSIIKEKINFNNQESILKFREIQIELKTKEITNILSFENFRLNDKNELSNNELIAYQILLNQLIQEEIKKSPFENSNFYNQLILSGRYKELEQEFEDLNNRLSHGEKVKTKKEEKEKALKKLKKEAERKYKKNIEQSLYNDSSSKYYKYKNIAHIKFGWAMTVHKAISYKFNEVLINVDQGDNRGKTNEGYFRWLYSALTRATNKITLINYTPINPFTKIRINIVQKEHKAFFFIGNLEELNNFIKAKIVSENIEISNINHHNYQEQYIFSDTNKNNATIGIYYNGKEQFKEPKLLSTATEEFGKKIISLLSDDNYLTSFDFITNGFKEVYMELNEKLNSENIYISYIIQKKYIDEIQFVSNKNSVIVEFNYNGDGFFTKVNIFNSNNSDLAKDIKNILKSL